MVKTKTTKRALLTSALSLLLCVSMLIGTTFAWFTDSVTSGRNTIQSGNLDVVLEYWNGTKFSEVTSATKLFDDAALWEPGHTEVAYLKVSNAGSLALKYQLAVSVYDETLGKTKDGKDIKLSDHLVFKALTIEEDKVGSYTRETAMAAAGTEEGLNTYNSAVTPLEKKGDADYIALIVYMPTTVGNEANHNGVDIPSIEMGIDLFATQFTYESDSFNNQYDKNAIIVTSATQAQAALDNAEPNTTIKLAPGVDYGTLYLRPVAGAAPTKEVDWQGNNYRFETYSRFENLTIVGANNATVDALVIEGGTYYNTPHSQSAAHPIMLSLIELNNVVIDGVTFTGNGGYDPQGHGNVVNLSGNNIKVDGLTIKNCVLENSDNTARLLYKTERTTAVHNYTYDGQSYTFVPSLKDITVTDCTFNGGYIGLELRETENVTITNNEFNVADRNILLPVNSGCSYSGIITIKNNVSNNAQERFVRADGTGSATVIITDNMLNNYMGADEDYIKVTNADAGCVSVANNTVTKATAAANAVDLSNALIAGGTVVLTDDIVVSNSVNLNNADFVLDGNGHIISMGDTRNNPYALFDITGGKATIKNVTFDGIKDGAVVRTVGGVEFTAENVVAQNGVHTQVQGAFRLLGKSTFKNCTFKNNTCNMVISLNYDGANNDPQLVENCVFENNTCNATAVVYYVKGAGCTLNGNTFVGNTVNCSGNGATVYMGFTENNVITNNVFKNNSVNESGASKRVAGALMVGYDTVITGNAFINNKVSGTNAKGNDVCASVYYSDIDLSGNYWNGSAPVENDNYFVEYPDKHQVIINDYLTTFGG